MVEREIYFHHQAQYSGLEDWNGGCTRAHADLFERIRGDVAELFAWVNAHSNATVYEDAYSPFCLLAEDTAQADLIYEYLVSYSQRVPHLTVVRNDVYARFAHAAYNKGTALAEISRQLGVAADRVLAAGDHLNDLPMLSVEYARWLVAPANAISEVKDAVRRQGGYVSHQPHGHGVTRGLEYWFEPVLAELGAGRPKG